MSVLAHRLLSVRRVTMPLPTVVTAVVVVHLPQVTGTAVASVITAAGAVPAPVVSSSATVTAAVVARTSTVNSPTMPTAASPAVVARTSAVSAPTVTASAAPAVTVAARTSTVHLPTPQTGTLASPAVIARTSTVNAVTIPTGPIDTFPGSSFAAHWTTLYGTYSVSGGVARITSQVGYSGALTNSGLSLIGRRVVIEAWKDTDPDPVANNTEIYLSFRTDVGSDVSVSVWQNDIIFIGAGANASVTYNATTHRWWRIREFGGTVYWDTSSDGITWTNRKTEATSGFTLTSGHVEIGAGRSAGTSNLGYFDNLNNAP